MRVAYLCVLIVALAACSTTQSGDFETSNIHITGFEISVADGVETSDTFQPKLQTVLANYAAAYNENIAGTVEPYTLRVNVTNVRYKHPVMSLLVGDGNSIKAYAWVVDPEDGSILREFDVSFLDGASVMINGVAGMVLSAAVQKETVETTLTRGIAGEMMKKAYAFSTVPAPIAESIRERDVMEPAEGEVEAIEQVDDPAPREVPAAPLS